MGFVFIIYVHNSTNYIFVIIESDILDVRITIEAKYIEFFENVFSMKSRSTFTSHKPSNAFNENEINELELGESERARKETNFGDDFYIYYVNDEPLTYQEAITSIDAHFGKKQLIIKLNLLCSHTWELVDLPSKIKPIGYKWIFKRKLKSDGSVNKHKVCLVAKGYKQKKNFDYFDTYQFLN